MVQLNDEYLVEKLDLTPLSFDEWISLQPGWKPLGPWGPEFDFMKRCYAGLHNELTYWSKESNWAEKRRKAGAILPRLLSILLFPYFLNLLGTKGGSKVPPPEKLGTVGYRMDRIGSRITEFERLFFLLLSEMAGKFYRDHINHVLRVMLLSNYLATEIRRQIVKIPGYQGLFYYFLTDEQEFETKIRIPLVLSSLYHDLAYPISEIHRMPKYLETILHGCYGVRIDIPKFPQARTKKAGTYLLSLSRSFFRPNAQSSDRLENEFKDALSKHQHGILAAMDFLELLEEDMGKNQEFDDLIWIAAQAMALHDVFMSKKNEEDLGIIKFVEYPVAFLLILCDELQDWGRPIGEKLPPILNSIGFDVSLEADGRTLIKADLDFSRACEGFSPFQQYKSKVDSLTRLSCDPEQGPILDVTIHVPEYEKKKWHTQRSRTDIDDVLRTGAIEIEGKPRPTDYLEISEAKYHTLNDMLINEKTKEIYDINRETDEDNFNKLRNTGLKISTCDCGVMTNNFQLNVDHPSYLFRKFASPLGEFHLRSPDGGWGYEPGTSPLRSKLVPLPNESLREPLVDVAIVMRQRRWTRLLSINPHSCHKCDKGYQDLI